MAEHTPASGLSQLPRYLAAVYALLIVDACLHPMHGWRISGLPLLAYLSAPWPHYFTASDIIFNVAGFVPLGFVLVPALGGRRIRVRALLSATLLGFCLSFAMETLQNFLPTRVSSNLDLAGNTLGCLLGAVGGIIWGDALFDQAAGLHRWRTAQIREGHLGDLGLIVLGLWLLTQLAPTAQLYENGDLRLLLGLPLSLPFSPERYLWLDAVITGVELSAVGLLTSCLQRNTLPWLALGVLCLGALIKTLATTIFFESGDALAWLTPGTRAGLIGGLPILTLLLLLPFNVRQFLATLLILAGAVLVNLMPENPFIITDSRLRPAGGFVNFHGVTQLTASLWPFAALAYMNLLGRRGNTWRHL